VVRWRWFDRSGSSAATSRSTSSGTWRASRSPNVIVDDDRFDLLAEGPVDDQGRLLV
jgi:hypothetical protein